MSSKNTVRRALVGLTAGVALAIAVPLVASAHVTVNPNQAEPGSYSAVVFRVPNESETASTVKLEVTLPTDTPFTSVRYEPIPGWTTTIVRSTLPAPVEVAGNTISEAATSIIWEAEPGAGIAQGQFQNMTVSLGPVPDVGSILLPAVQTYDDGEVAEWTATPDEVAADDTLDPAPVLYVNDAPPADEHSGSHATDTTDHDTTVTAAAPADPQAGVSLGLSIAALVIAALAAVLAALGLARRPRKA
ncbi:YcnI family protein [Microbacterium sp. cx-55]|uniref:YcnI family copper-binding membrane protein n=1 Tax=Microbacterium sp. cx-55 TaxID=2875948 RepID=UPI001CBD2394|nr:YcnI family protein [Microbacterium sp. cx-55]MBZ4486091.1 YcnI family protein [Microbacterium sp. cx-55]UGB34038.1 YcnI family protein [Microbacterium sp. cx-55]